jgi:hypothetical protein
MEEAKMANKQDFTAEEWARIRESVMLASIAVTAADPSGAQPVLPTRLSPTKPTAPMPAFSNLL